VVRLRELAALFLKMARERGLNTGSATVLAMADELARL